MSPCFKSVNSHRDRGGRARETQNCRHLWSGVSASQQCQQSQGSGGSWSRNPELSSLLDSSRVVCVSKVSTVIGIGGVVLAKRRIVVTCGLGCLRLNSVNSHRDREGRGREAQNCRHSWIRLGSSAPHKCQQSQGSGGSCSRNPELSSLVDSSRVSVSPKCQQSQGSGGSWLRNPELSSLLDSPLER